MRRSLVIFMYDFAPEPSEFPYIWGKFVIYFYQCALQLCCKIMFRTNPYRKQRILSKKGIEGRFRDVIFALMGFIGLSSVHSKLQLCYNTCTNRTHSPYSPPSPHSSLSQLSQILARQSQSQILILVVLLGCNGEYFLLLLLLLF